MISTAMLMTAGLGTRLRPFTNIATKALLPVMGVPGAQFAIDSLVHSGVETIVANIHHDALNTKLGLLSLSHPGARMVISDESKELLGSAGGIRHALPHLGESPFFYMTSDTICDLDFQALANQHLKNRSQWGVHLTLAVFPSSPAGLKYREIHFDFQTGLITSLGGLTSGRPFFIGAAVLEREAFERVPKTGSADFVQHLLLPAIREKKAGVFLTSGVWYDFGSPSLWLKIHLAMIQRLERDEFQSGCSHLWKSRIKGSNSRIQEQIWVAQGAPVQESKSLEWEGPCYWGYGKSGEIPPQRLGPKTVLYGSVRQVDPIRSGIGYGGIWFQVPDSEEF